VKALYDQGKLILVNGQESTASERNHILGAIAISGDQFPANIVFPKNRIIAVYCN
jgi:rhodanese-related sulfurtransferase